MFESNSSTRISPNALYEAEIATLKSEKSKSNRIHAKEVTELKNTRSLLSDSKTENSKLKTKVEKLQSLMNKKQNEISQILNPKFKESFSKI